VDVFFEGIERKNHSTRSGTCELPILYRDASQFGVFFRVELDRARDVIGSGKSASASSAHRSSPRSAPTVFERRSPPAATSASYSPSRTPSRHSRVRGRCDA
jgi:hypothetical protein